MCEFGEGGALGCWVVGWCLWACGGVVEVGGCGGDRGWVGDVGSSKSPSLTGFFTSKDIKTPIQGQRDTNTRT